MPGGFLFVRFFKALAERVYVPAFISEAGEAEGLAGGGLFEDLAIVVGRVDVVLG